MQPIVAIYKNRNPMKTKTLMVALATLLIGSLCFFACQKDEPISGKPDTAEHIQLKTEQVEPDCNTHCINPDEEVYFEKTDQQSITWAGPDDDKFSKTIYVVYYNILTHFVLKVKSTNGIADILVDGESVKDFDGTIAENTWHEFTFPLSDDWQACDPWSFELQITGYGPPAYLSVEYQLVGECSWPRDTETLVVDVYNPVTGKTWMDRNLGASRAATSSTDAEAYGDLYQWGRPADGHQKRNSPTTTTLSNTDQPGHGGFILSPVWDPHRYDWRIPQNDNLWQGVNGVNNPCPTGYRLPTEAELNAERLSWSSNNSAGALASPLMLPVAGFRYFSNGSLYFVGSFGHYWSSTVDGTYSRFLFFNSSSASLGSNYRAFGYSVRCLKD